MTPPRLLIADKPLQVLPTLAKAIGLSEAIVLQQIHYVSLGAAHQREDGWVELSIGEWHSKEFDFISRPTVERIFKRLRDLNLIEARVEDVTGKRSRQLQKVRRQLWIRVNYQALEELSERVSWSHQIDVTNDEGRSHQVDVGEQTLGDIKVMSPPTNKGTTEASEETANAVSSSRKSSTSSQISESAFSQDVRDLAAYFAECRLANDEKAKVKPTSKAWLDPLRLLIERDKRTPVEIRQVIAFTQNDSFEKRVVLSPGKLRDRFDGLYLSARDAMGVDPNAPSHGDRLREMAEQLEADAAAVVEGQVVEEPRGMAA